MNTFLPALRLFAVLTLLTGIVYPLTVSAFARLLFPKQAGGSLVVVGGRVRGSALLAQRFASSRYLWPRPSAGDDGTNYATVASAASNQGPTSAGLKLAVAARADALRAAHGLATDASVPPELVLASGSGLDPHLSPDAVRFQLDRVGRARGFNAAQRTALARLVEQSIEPPQWGFLGEPRVNVLTLNLALDQLE